MANDIELTPNREKAIVKFMFGNKDMKQLVKSAGLALESENRHLENCFNARLWKEVSKAFVRLGTNAIINSASGAN